LIIGRKRINIGEYNLLQRIVCCRYDWKPVDLSIVEDLAEIG